MMPEYRARGVGKLLSNGQIKTLIASHVGLNPEVAQRMNTDVEEDKLECILVPQGTLAERIRAGGAGLGGFLTPTGVWYHCGRRKRSRSCRWKRVSFRNALKSRLCPLLGVR